MNTTIVTSIVGDRDTLIDDQIDDSSFKYIAFTEQISNRWLIKPPCKIFKENRRNAKIHKILIHKFVKCDVSIWIDGNVKLLKSPAKLIQKYMDDYDIILMRHAIRKNILEESSELIHSKFDFPQVILNQIKDYKNLSQLFWLSFIIRKHTPKIARLNEKWWSEISCHSFRDQLSLPELIKDQRVKILEPDEYQKYFVSQFHKPIIYE